MGPNVVNQRPAKFTMYFSVAAPPNQPATLSPGWKKKWVAVFLPFAWHCAQDLQSPERTLRYAYFFDLKLGATFEF
jgi:hypothetical protein